MKLVSLNLCAKFLKDKILNMLTQRQIILIGSFLGGVAVALGAFGAHAFKDLLVQNNRVDTYELAVRYHFFHALALLLIALLMEKVERNMASRSAICMSIGTLLFSGSLYIMALANTTSVALITPFGGVFLLIGWGLLFYSAWRGEGKR
jgi:uncharacterized membrane protein YgdD (TMEM256/DUF423 family)